VLFDAVVVLAGAAGDDALSADPNAVSFLMDACRHLKAIGLSGATTLAEKAEITDVVGVTDLDSASDIAEFIKYAKNGRVWDREAA
jgi:catalase